MENWHNIRWTRRENDGTLKVNSDFEMSVAEAVENDLFHKRGTRDLLLVEFSGPAGGPHFENVTDHYLAQYRRQSQS